MPTYGARVYPPNKKSDRMIIKQTRKNDAGNFVVDGHKEAFVPLNDDRAIAEAIRTALTGSLKSKNR